MVSTPSIRLVAGLGNPGAEYGQTRHNAGFWFADELARCQDGVFRREARFHGEVCRIRLEGAQLWLLKPDTWMNRSGQAVARLANFYKIPLEQILVAHDDLDLPPGTVRLKRGGGHGGHNGLRDIITLLGGNGFLRLRIGIGHPGSREQVTPFVLGAPPESERQLIEEAIDRAVGEVPSLVRGEFQKVMNRLHSRQPSVSG